jgi:hypothetical protein
MTRAIAFAAALTLSVSSLAAETALMPLSDVKKGMRGHGLTVFEGSRIEKFEVEILGVLRNVSPGQNLILARVDSEPVKTTGIIAGMSGSPVIVDGKVIGALAYAWQFSKDSIAGITPIDDMLALEHRGAKASDTVGVTMSSNEVLQALATRQHVALFDRMMKAAVPQRMSAVSGATPISIPLSMGSFDASTVARFGSFFEASGFLAAPSGQSAATKSAPSASPFVPGDAVAAVLVDGDFSMAATGTVTHVSGKNVLGFGHPFLDMGTIDFPMAKAEVVAVLPNLARSFKFSNTGEIVGALTQDRAAGILGSVGATASMIPVELWIDGAENDETYKFRVADHAQLMPVLLAMAVDSVIAGRERAQGERSVVMEADITLSSREPLQLREAWAGSDVRQAIPAYLGLVSNYLLSNEYRKTEIEGVKIRLRHDDSLRIAKVLDASILNPAPNGFRPGDKVRVNARLKPFRGEVINEILEITIPESQKSGETYLLLGGGGAFNQIEFMMSPPDPRSFDQVISTIQRLRPSRELNAALFAQSDGVVAAGVLHPDLPPSMQAVVSNDSSNSTSYAVKYKALDRASKPLDFVVDGIVRIDLPIRPRS